MANYRVNLDIFAGPLDLLLYLVRKDEVDIYDIPLARITEQYINYIEMLKRLDIDLAGDFLVMAATLMQIKSAMLLPSAEPEKPEDELGDPRNELIRQLLDYKKFKDAAGILNTAADEQIQRFSRPGTVIERLTPNIEPEIDIEQVSVWDLLEAFDAICKATGTAIDLTHIEDDTPIDLYQIEILHRLQTEGTMNFERVFPSGTNRLVMVGLFLALLELIREKLIMVYPERPVVSELVEGAEPSRRVEHLKSSNQLYLRPLTDEPAEKAVQKAILGSEAELEPAPQQEKPQRQKPSIPIAELPPKNKPATSVDEYEKIQPAGGHQW